jgi:hypothetical protein
LVHRNCGDWHIVNAPNAAILHAQISSLAIHPLTLRVSLKRRNCTRFLAFSDYQGSRLEQCKVYGRNLRDRKEDAAMTITNRREFLPPNFVRKLPVGAGPSGFDFPSTYVGAAGNVTVYYATSLGSSGQTLAEALLNIVTGPYDDMESFFGISGGSVIAVVSPLSANNDGTGGAYHYGCDFASGGTLYLDATFTLANATDVELALYVAELSECFMGAQGLGWGCSYSNGEGLSRFCAEVDTPSGSFPSWGITGPSWVSVGYPDWVTNTEQTDGDYASTGCAILYIYWMRSLNYSTEQIIKAAGATLAANYKTLTGKDTAYADLKAAVQAVKVTSDNPFNRND